MSMFHNSNIIIFLYITESQTIEDFGDTLHLDRSDLEHLRSVFLAVENGDIGKYYLFKDVANCSN